MLFVSVFLAGGGQAPVKSAMALFKPGVIVEGVPGGGLVDAVEPHNFIMKFSGPRKLSL